jgi:hypothetical protein
MKLRFSIRVKQVLAPVLCITLGGLFPSFAQTGPEGSKSHDEPLAESTNVHPKRYSNRLLQLEERLTRALKGLTADTTVPTLGPKLRPPVVRKVPKKEDQEDALAKRDWMLMTPESFAEHEASLELRKMLKDGGLLKNPAVNTESQWLNDLNRNNGGTRGLVDSMTSGEMQRGPNLRENSTPAEVARTEENLRSLMRDRQSSWNSMAVTPERERNLADAFRPPAEDLSPFRRKEESYVDDYRKLMTPAPIQTFASTVPNLNPALTDPTRPVPPPTGLELMTPSPSARSIFTPQLGSIAPLKSPRTPLDTTEQAVNQWNKYYVPPPPEPPRSLAPPKPTFEAPRRKF